MRDLTRLARCALACTMALGWVSAGRAADEPGRWLLVKLEEYRSHRPAVPPIRTELAMSGVDSLESTYRFHHPSFRFTGQHSWSRPLAVYNPDGPLHIDLVSSIRGEHLDPRKGPVRKGVHTAFRAGCGRTEAVDAATTSDGPPRTERRTLDSRFFGRPGYPGDNALESIHLYGGETDPNDRADIGVSYWYQWIPHSTAPQGGEATSSSMPPYPANAAPLNLAGLWTAGCGCDPHRWTFRPVSTGRYLLEIQGGLSGTAEVLSSHTFRVRYGKPSFEAAPDSEKFDYVMWLTPNRRAGAGLLRHSTQDPVLGSERYYRTLWRTPEPVQPDWARNAIPAGFAGTAPAASSPTPPASPPKPVETAPGLTIQALVDGVSELHVTGTGVWWKHLSWSKPGRNKGQREPTRVGGVDWQPRWKNAGDGGEDTSDTFPVRLSTLDVQVVPDPKNRNPVKTRREGSELVIVFDDPQPDDAWYTVRLVSRP